MNAHLITKLTMTNKKKKQKQKQKNKPRKESKESHSRTRKPKTTFWKKKKNKPKKKHQKKKRKKKETEGIPRPVETSQKRFHKTYYFRFLTCKFPLYDDGSPSKHLPPFTMLAIKQHWLYWY